MHATLAARSCLACRTLYYQGLVGLGSVSDYVAHHAPCTGEWMWFGQQLQLVMLRLL